MVNPPNGLSRRASESLTVALWIIASAVALRSVHWIESATFQHVLMGSPLIFVIRYRRELDRCVRFFGWWFLKNRLVIRLLQALGVLVAILCAVLVVGHLA